MNRGVTTPKYITSIINQVTRVMSGHRNNYSAGLILTEKRQLDMAAPRAFAANTYGSSVAAPDSISESVSDSVSSDFSDV